MRETEGGFYREIEMTRDSPQVNYGRQRNANRRVEQGAARLPPRAALALQKAWMARSAQVLWPVHRRNEIC